MPRDPSLDRVLVIGSGPIVIGQACEFDYSGTQAVKALRREGIEVVLVNSNPATIMTDPEYADRTYIEPLTADFLERILERERPDALLPTVGGQTALNLAVELSRTGVLDRLGVRLIGAGRRTVEIAEDRRLFKEAMVEAGLDVPRSGYARSLQAARAVRGRLGIPVVVRPSFTLGGMGGGIAYNDEEFDEIVSRGLELSPAHEILVEESVLGWKEYELEVMRDRDDNFVVVCAIENLDPMGVHTGDSVTVAPAQTLTDKEYQAMRNDARLVMSVVGVETGGSNIQFAVDPRTGRRVVIEMNPRVSRSSALASKATGFPIAKIAALLAIGYRLDEIPNDITRVTPASFEPALDYVVVKIPRWAFEKFPQADPTLGTQMKSVGEAMAIGRTFKEALQKALRSLESTPPEVRDERLNEKLLRPDPDRLFYVFRALELGLAHAEIHRMTGIDPWFLDQMQQIVDLGREIASEPLTPELLRRAKRAGFSDAGIAKRAALDESGVRSLREAEGIVAVMKRVDTCAAEFESHTPYLYSTYERECEAEPTNRRKVLILGSGPNRIGQGIEFDYCCCHAAFALREEGYETILMNSNPETVSTDYDTADRLYFEPLTFEDVMNVVMKERPEGVVVQFGGQTPLRLALPLQRAGVRILGTSPDAIDLAEDRKRFSALLREMRIKQPESGTAASIEEAREAAARVGYPVLVRPSYVLGGRAMAIVYDEPALTRYMREAVDASPEHPVLVDRFLEDAFEVDVDAIADGQRVVIGGIMQHIEQAGIHSGDSSAVLPSYRVDPRHLPEIRETTRRLGLALSVVGLMNVQFAIRDGTVYVLEVNPRASRTVPFICKATGVPLARMAARLLAGRTLEELGLTGDLDVRHVFVKAPVFPFLKLPGVDPLLGPEMRSTGEVMGSSDDFGMAFAKAQIAAGWTIPTTGTAFLSVHDQDKQALLPVARDLAGIGFALTATRGTAEFLEAHGVHAERVFKVNEGRPSVVDLIRSRRISLIVNTPLGRESYYDETAIRKSAILHGVLCVTTLTGAAATVAGIRSLQQRAFAVAPLQELYVSGEVRRPGAGVE